MEGARMKIQTAGAATHTALVPPEKASRAAAPLSKDDDGMRPRADRPPIAWLSLRPARGMLDAVDGWHDEVAARLGRSQMPREGC